MGKWDAQFEDFLAKERGENIEQEDEKKIPAPLAPKKHSAMESDEPFDMRHPERAAEKEKEKENNFGKINLLEYGANLDAALQARSTYYNKPISKKDEKTYYTEVVENAVKMSQLPEKDESDFENVADGFMLKTLADRLKRKYEAMYKRHDLNISIYSANGSELEKDKGVVAIVECGTPEHIIKEKFYLTTRGYKRDVREGYDNPEPCRLMEDFQHLGVRAVSIPIPYDGFSDKEHVTVLKGTLPKKICDDAAGKILKNFSLEKELV
jgi:hypothetical protein